MGTFHHQSLPPCEGFRVRQGILKLLAVKDSDIRLLTLAQSRDAVDKGIHAGGALSATIPLVALYYGGFLDIDVADPTRRGQDLFTLSKGHAVAALASIYAELGYFDQSHLKNSRSFNSILNGHPGPVLPGIHVATGPMGQGLGVAQGLAIAGRTAPRFDSYVLTGDGELQEGPIWESVMFAAAKHLDNFCVMVDRNYGQLDLANRMIFPMPELSGVFTAFGWNACDVDATDYDGVYTALERFRFGPRNGKPTAIVCHSTKGFGGLSEFLNKHKVTTPDKLIEQEIEQQQDQRRRRVEDFNRLYRSMEANGERDQCHTLAKAAQRMHLGTRSEAGGLALDQQIGPVVTRRAAPRNKNVHYDRGALPVIDKNKEYAAADIVTAAMKVFARDRRVVSIDSDLATTSGLEAGVGAVDQTRALNVGVAEANMSLIGEAFAVLGCNTWISTFCPFFDWKVLRRTAVGHQERLEAIEAPDGWLSEGHGLDLTMMATAADFETRTNGATHMGNDDCLVFDAIGHLKIIDVSCPQQMLSLMQWIMEGNRGLLYVRVMRTPSAVVYPNDYRFEFGTGHVLRRAANDAVVIVSSGRGVHEALAAARSCAAAGVPVRVVDMPSIDEELLVALYDSRKPMVIAEQNNGFIWQNFLKALARYGNRGIDPERIVAINTLDKKGHAHFIHSGTYEELTAAFGLDAASLARKLIDLARNSRELVGSRSIAE
jgi:transketolase N-terminal domain/subunit/transketolase C-terminal domain/subunit